jgi:hypothetical protein
MVCAVTDDRHQAGVEQDGEHVTAPRQHARVTYAAMTRVGGACSLWLKQGATKDGDVRGQMQAHGGRKGGEVSGQGVTVVVK